MVKPEPTEGVVPGPSPAHRQPAVPASSSSTAQDPSSASTAAPDDTLQNELLPSFFKIEPFDEMQKRIGDWIWSISRGHEHIEIEAKIGRIKQPKDQRRLQGMLFETEAILKPPANPQTDPFGLRYYFDSDMTSEQHRHFNRLLNKETSDARASPFPVQYQHLYETDHFRMAGTRKVRVRKEQRTGRMIQTCHKVRLGDLNVHCPMSKFDWRLSVSTETPLAEEPDTPDLNKRTKDRMSYIHQAVQIDLSLVSTEDGKRRHELEVEVLNVDQMMEEAAAAERQENNCYEQLVGALVSTVRLLVRNAP